MSNDEKLPYRPDCNSPCEAIGDNRFRCPIDGDLSADEVSWMPAYMLAHDDGEESGPPSDNHIGVELVTDSGNTAIAHVSPDIDPKTVEALNHLIDAAYKAIERGEIDKGHHNEGEIE